MNQNRATLIGMLAILLWSAIVGLIKSVSEGFGPVGGAAMIYTCGAILLWFTIGIPNLSQFPRRYLIWGSLLFVAYELCLSLSLGFSHNSKQAIEVGMVNYLWPALTIVLTVLVNKKKARWFIIPGILLSLVGIIKVLGGEQGIEINEVINNVSSNPLSYGLALIGAVIWAIYCVVTQRIANGNNGVTLFFTLVALVLWGHFFTTSQPSFHFSYGVWVSLGFAAIAMGFGYAAWNIGILHGNVTALATASYFIPVISAMIASFILDSPLSLNFWQGAAMVSIGSLICWLSTKNN